MQIYNAEIESADVTLDRGCFLSAWVFVKFADGSQGFGGFVLGALPSAKAGDHANQPNFAAEFLTAVMAAAGVESWKALVGKTIRIKKENSLGPILAIGHIYKDDLWFHPKERFEGMRGATLEARKQ